MLSPKINSEKIKEILANETAGLYLLDKPKGLHSFHLVTKLRHILGHKKVGFAGTLDPLASGLMILASGPATKLLDFFHFMPKVYEAEILFGQTSPSYDLEQAVQINLQAKEFDRKKLEKFLENFIGEQYQRAPIFSAKKVSGQKLNKLARRGKTPEAPKKKINIFDIKLQEFDYPKIKIIVTCSAGTYIRSLAHDLGESLGTGALLSDLRRMAIGSFSIKKAASFDQLDQRQLSKSKISAQELIDGLREYHVQSHL